MFLEDWPKIIFVYTDYHETWMINFTTYRLILLFLFFIYLFIYLFIFACNVDLERFLSLQKPTFGRSARLKFELLIYKYKIEGQNSSKLFFND